jgi:hypothetical protein
MIPYQKYHCDNRKHGGYTLEYLNTAPNAESRFMCRKCHDSDFVRDQNFMVPLIDIFAQPRPTHLRNYPHNKFIQEALANINTQSYVQQLSERVVKQLEIRVVELE